VLPHTKTVGLIFIKYHIGGPCKKHVEGNICLRPSTHWTDEWVEGGGCRMPSPFIAEAQALSYVRPCGTCGEQSGTGTGFSLTTPVLPSTSCHQCFVRIHSFISNAV
jgi:hypothetical protein